MRIKEVIEQSVEIKKSILEDEVFIQNIEKIVEVMVSSLSNGGKIHFCGNGGSAADAQHLAAELSGRFYFNRPALNAEALHCNTSYMTAVGNDYGFDQVYSRLLSGIGKKGDVLLGISTSGNSFNILRAYEVAKEMGITTVSLTGATGGRMKENSDYCLNVPSSDIPRIQEVHILIGHIICELVEQKMFEHLKK